MKDNHPLVSICVITYNSAKYILETLNSIEQQTYKNIELIISDDCSNDNTISICDEWICRYKYRFINVKLITHDVNTGVACNCNRAFRVASGTWIKALAGDDILLPDAIQTYIEYVSEAIDCQICFAPMTLFGDNKTLVKQIEIYYNNYCYPYIKMGLKQQKNRILKYMFVPGPGVFIRKRLWEDIGGYDESYPMCEEYPFILKIIFSGNKVHWVDKPAVMYRIASNSLSHNYKNKVGKSTFDDNYNFFLKTRRRYLMSSGYIIEALHQTIMLYIQYLDYNNSKYKHIAKLLILFSPKAYVKIIKKCLGSK